jgi:hypothetical protein
MPYLWLSILVDVCPYVAREKDCICTRSSGYVFAGDCHNPATFWATRYFDLAKTWKFEEFLPIASQIIVDAVHVNRGSIRGLELVRCDSRGIQRLSVEECKQWVRESTKRSNAIEKKIVAPLSKHL